MLLLVSLVIMVMVNASAETTGQAVRLQVLSIASSSTSSVPPAAEWNLTFAEESANSVIQTNAGGYALIGKGYQSSVARTTSGANMHIALFAFLSPVDFKSNRLRRLSSKKRLTYYHSIELK
jgi:hypothetical protein